MNQNLLLTGYFIKQLAVLKDSTNLNSTFIKLIISLIQFTLMFKI